MGTFPFSTTQVINNPPKGRSLKRFESLNILCLLQRTRCHKGGNFSTYVPCSHQILQTAPLFQLGSSHANSLCIFFLNFKLICLYRQQNYLLIILSSFRLNIVWFTLTMKTNQQDYCSRLLNYWILCK